MAVVVVAGLMAGVLGCATASTQESKPKPLSPTERAQLMSQSASSAYLTGQTTQALSDILEAEKLDSSLPEVHHLKGIILYSKRDVDAAVASVRKALELNPKFSAAKNTLGKFLFDLGQTEEAEKLLLDAASDLLYFEGFKARTNLGILYYRQGQYDRAMEQLRFAVKDSASGACIAHYYEGHIHLRKNKVKDAIASYDRATRNACGSFTDAHYAKGLAYMKDGQFDAARKKFLEIRKLFPDSKVAGLAMEQLRAIP